MASLCLRVLCLTLFTWSGVVSEPLYRREGLADRLKKYAEEEDAKRNTTELIRSKGYPCEEYNVVTEDGFILGLQRIPHGLRNGPVGSVRPVVFLQHGLLDASSTWVINSAAQSLGFLLADAGFDVWLGNVRGNTYSKRHSKLLEDDQQFWAWSWDQMAKYDLPAMLKFALATTGQPDLSYVGHSQGTLIAFACFSQDPELAKKVKAFVALGPVLKLGHVEGGARFLVGLAPDLQILFELLGLGEFLPNDAVMRFLAETLCRGSVSRYLCENVIFLLAGYDVQQLNASRLPVYVSHAPAGTSVRNMVHFAQLVKTNKVQMYDFGSDELNRQHYNQPFPPIYNTSAFNVPTYVYSGERDLLSTPQDVKAMLLQVRSVVTHRQIPKFSHIDFLWGMQANEIFYKDVIQILQKQLLKKGDYNNANFRLAELTKGKLLY